jgi:AAA domain
MNDCYKKKFSYAYPDAEEKARTLENLENIPQQLKDVPQWLAWKHEEDKDLDKDGQPKKPKKTPLVPSAPKGQPNYLTRRDWWKSFEAVVSQVRSGKADGIGFILTKEDPFFCIDLDKCFNDPERHQRFLETARIFKTYCEISASGTGVHFFGLGKKPEGAGSNSQKLGIEAYDGLRFIAITGDVHGAGKLRDCQAEFTAFCDEYLPRKTRTDPTASAPLFRADLTGIPTDDQTLLDHIQTCYPKTYEYLQKPGDSDSDYAAFKKINALTGNDFGRTERIMRSTAAYRPKWDDPREGGTENFLAWQIRQHPADSAECAEALEGLKKFRTLQQINPGRKPQPGRRLTEAQGGQMAKGFGPAPKSSEDVRARHASEAPRLFKIGGRRSSEAMPKPIVKGFAYKGYITLESAPPRSSKSTVAMMIGLAAATGDPIGPFVPGDGATVPVLYVDSDEPVPGRTERALDKMCPGWETSGNFLLMQPEPDCQPKLTLPLDIEALLETVKANGIKLLIVDTLQKTMNLGFDFNKADEMKAYMGALQRIATEGNCAIILVHHDKKAGGGFAGSLSLSSEAQIHVQIAKFRAVVGGKEYVRLKHENNRMGDIVELLFHAPMKTDELDVPGRLELVREKTGKLKPVKVGMDDEYEGYNPTDQDRIYNWMMGTSAQVSIREISERLSISYDYAKKVMNILKSEGHVKVVKNEGGKGRSALWERKVSNFNPGDAHFREHGIARKRLGVRDTNRTRILKKVRYRLKRICDTVPDPKNPRYGLYPLLGEGLTPFWLKGAGTVCNRERERVSAYTVPFSEVHSREKGGYGKKSKNRVLVKKHKTHCEFLQKWVADGNATFGDAGSGANKPKEVQSSLPTWWPSAQHTNETDNFPQKWEEENGDY